MGVLIDMHEIQNIILTLTLLVVFAIYLRFKQKSAITETDAYKTVEEKTEQAKPIAPRLASIEDVAAFFLNIYRMQMGADSQAHSKIKPLPPSSARAGNLYELSIQINGNWKSRRMTISPLGAETSSKSQCFYVIFGTHLVIKIPPVPIRDFNDYISRIRYESSIVQSLSPRKCIIPNVSAIMSKVHHFDDSQQLSAEQLEKRLVSLLERSPDYHDCLKINNTFVFFMDLSRDYFLGYAMAGFQRDDDHVIAAEDAGMTPDCQAFEAKYGAEQSWICFELQDLYNRFATGIRQMGSQMTIGEAQKRDWFFSKLIGQLTDPPLHGLSDRFQETADDLLNRLFNEQAGLVRTYRKLVHEYAQKRSFRRNKPKMEALVINLLDLLDWLDECRVTVRDLKPDNLLVVGDPGQYPFFMNSTDGFFVGLIDLETATTYPAPGEGECPQPQLAGTPAYATPSHIFPNELLAKFYPDVGSILHLQDWQAILAIIFEVITGQQLFQKTGRQILETIRSVRFAVAQTQSLNDVYRSANGLFWKQARQELYSRITQHSWQLEAVTAVVPEAIQIKLEVFLEEEIPTVEKSIREEVDNQSLIRGEAKKQQLYTCSHQAICQAMRKCSNSGKASAKQLIPFFETLAELKERQDRFKHMHQAIREPLVRISAKDIMALMFECVAQAMAVEGAVPEAPAPHPDPIEPSVPDAATVVGFTHSAEVSYQ
jgi:serine/threonine protein kinase